MTRAMRVTAALMLGAVLVVPAKPTAQAKADVALRAAMETETVKGDLKGAIEEYKKIVAGAGTNRALAAQALVRMAECYQKLGDAEARKIYERLIREFGDQKEVAALARTRLSQRAASTSGLVARQLWTGSGVGLTEASIGADGRTAAVIDPASGRDLAMLDLSSSQTTRLMVTSAESISYAEWPVLSPDLHQMAYAWSGPETGWSYQVRAVGTERGAKPRILVNNPEFGYVFLHAWAKDGKGLLATILSGGNGNMAQIAWVSVADGAVKTLKSMEWRSPGMARLSPDGRYIAYDALTQQDGPEREIKVIAADGSSESVLVKAPGINQAPVWTRDGARIVFKSDRSGNFGLWSIAVRDGKADGPLELVKADVGDIAPIGFTGAGSLLYTQQIGTRDVYEAQIDSVTGKIRGNSARLVDTFVGSNMNPTWSPDDRSIAYLSLRARGGSGAWTGTLVIRSLDSGQERTIATPFQYGGQPMWSSDGQTILEVARNRQNNTSLYTVNLKTGEVREVLNTGNMAPPYATLSPDGKTAFMAPGATLAAYELATGRRMNLSHPGAIKGVAVSPDGRTIAFVAHEYSPTSGRAHLYVSNPDGSQVRELLTTEQRDGFPWAVSWSSDSRFIYYTRGLQPNNIRQLWRISADGGTPEYAGLTVTGMGSFDVSRDGTRIVYEVGGSPKIEAWALDNLETVLKASR